MRSILITTLSLFISIFSQAQEVPGKLVLHKGDIIKVTNEINSANTQVMREGEPMEMKTKSTSFTELLVKEVKDSAYIMTQTVKKMTLDFEGFGQNIHYDSDSKDKIDNPMIKPLADKVGVAEEIKLGFDGKVIEDESANDKSKDGRGRGGMRMMGRASSSSVEGAFLVIPKEAIAKGGWESTSEKDGLKTRRKYTLGAMMGSMATVTVQSQTKGEIEINRGGMPMTTKVNTLTEEMIIVDISTGKVQMHNTTMNDNGKTVINGNENPTTGKTTISTTVE